MGLITWIKAVWNKLFKREIKERFGADILLSDVMEAWINRFYNITSGNAPWVDPEDDVESINWAGQIDDITAGLVTLDIGIEMPDTPRGQYLQKYADYVLQIIHDKVSEGLGNCGVMFKPNGENVDYVEPGNFAPTDCDSNGNILGCVFQNQIQRNDWTYTKLEYHRFEKVTGEDVQEQKVYRISNYCYKKRGMNVLFNSPGDPCALTEVSEWANLLPEWEIDNVDRPLFAYFKNPAPNRLDRSSPLGVPIWHNCLKELKDLDIAWSRKAGEVEDSKHMTFLPSSVIRYADQHNVKLPRWVKGVEYGNGVDSDNSIHEHVSTLLTDQRITDINSILAMISTKCGFSQGFFVLDEKTGMMTATQVEADDQETIRTIKNIRDALQSCLTNLFYALDKFADYYTDLPPENWDSLELSDGTQAAGLKDSINYNFGNILYNWNEDRANWWNYVIQGKMPPWLYFVKFEGMSEEEAKKLTAEAQPKEEPGFFEEE